MGVSASFQIIPRPESRLGLGLGLRSGPYVVGRLGSGPPAVVGQLGSRVCRLADGGGERGKCPTPCKKGRGNVRRGGGEYVRGEKCPQEMSEGEMSYTCLDDRLMSRQFRVSVCDTC